MKIENYIIDVKNSIYKAMECIDQNSKGIIYVTKSSKLYGVITDGDIRRYFLKKGNLDGNIEEIVNINCYYLTEDQVDVVYLEMHNRGLNSIPIVNEKNEIVEIYFSNERTKRKEQKLQIPVVIMAGGKGTRLYPYTQILPKPLIPIGDKTITEHIMDRFIEYGCDQFTMIVNYKKHFIKSYFIDNEEQKSVKFVDEEEFLGTGGGLKLLDKKIESTFFMTNCDILIEEDYSKILKYHKEHNNIITMVCAIKNMTIPYGTVDIREDGSVIRLKEKPELSFITNTGFYVIEPEFLKLIPENTFIHITDLIQQCIEEGRNVGVYKISEDKWLDMGQLDELEKMKEKLNVN